MRTLLDTPPEAPSELDRKFLDQIAEQGWFRTSVSGGEEGPAFSYSTGFWLNAGFPEIIAFSLPGRTIHDTLWDLYREIREGVRPRICTPVEGVFGNLRACLLPVAPAAYREYLCFSDWFYLRAPVPSLQLVWPDRADIFPWEAGFDPEFASDQPDLTEHGWRVALVAGGIEAPAPG